MRAGVKVEEITPGTGALDERETVVTIHDRGFLHRGGQFRSSYDEGQPLRVRLGRREVIAGLECGLLGMRVGGRRRLVSNPHLPYGKTGGPGIVPPNKDLTRAYQMSESEQRCAMCTRCCQRG
jgi:FKBP-type peptidyl-prolyl cis-trans isomerase